MNISRKGVLSIIEKYAKDNPKAAKVIADDNRVTFPAIRAKTSEELANYLRLFGISVNPDVMRSLASNYLASEELDDFLIETHGLQDKISNDEDDRIWVSLAVLWERWCPDITNTDMVIDSLSGVVAARDTEPELKTVVEKNLDAWKLIKKLQKRAHCASFEDFDELLGCDISVLAWREELRTMMDYVVMYDGDESYREKRRQFDREFRTVFPRVKAARNPKVQGRISTLGRNGRTGATGGFAIGFANSWRLPDGADDSGAGSGEDVQLGNAYGGKSGTQSTAVDPNDPSTWPKHIGRNDPCPCGSGKKYKKCHGR